MPIVFIRFLLVGMLNTAFGYGCFAIFLYAGLHYSLALLAATVVGVLFNFKTIGAMVFKSIDNSPLLRFIMVYAVVYGVNLLGIEVLTHIGASPYLGGAIMVFPMAVFAFILQKRFVFANA